MAMTKDEELSVRLMRRGVKTSLEGLDELFTDLFDDVLRLSALNNEAELGALRKKVEHLTECSDRAENDVVAARDDRNVQKVIAEHAKEELALITEERARGEWWPLGSLDTLRDRLDRANSTLTNLQRCRERYAGVDLPDLVLEFGKQLDVWLEACKLAEARKGRKAAAVERREEARQIEVGDTVRTSNGTIGRVWETRMFDRGYKPQVRVGEYDTADGGQWYSLASGGNTCTRVDPLTITLVPGDRVVRRPGPKLRGGNRTHGTVAANSTHYAVRIHFDDDAEKTIHVNLPVDRERLALVYRAPGSPG